jgi:hypothetical protein
MPDLIRDALPLVPFALLPALLLLLAPLCGRRARTAFAALLGIIAVGFVADVLASDHGHALTLAVPNVFPRGPDAEPHRWIMATVTAPAWHYHVWIAVMLLLPAVVLFVRRDRAPGPPRPALHGAGVFLFYLVLRLGLEQTAAHEQVVWATGGTFALLLILPFFGWYCGRRGDGPRRFVSQLLLMAYLQRLPLIAIALVATTQHLGTHLDTHVVTDIALPGFGEVALASDFARWLHPTGIPHLTLWVVMTLVAGLALGAGPYWLARRRSGAVPAPTVAPTA